MRQLHPVPLDDVDPVEAYASEVRDRSPWLLVNMISTADGATSIAGRSGALGGPADRRVFNAIRGLADAIVVGAGTVRAENYGPPTVEARLLIVSARLDLDPAARVFSGGTRPSIITSATADADRRRALEPVADIVVAGETTVDLRRALAPLSGVVVCEGGPSLNGQLIADDLVDELCLSFAPLLAAGESSRVAHGTDPSHPRGLELRHVLEKDGMLFLRYRRRLSDASVPSAS
ncbi:MAG TPA: dihydrofolate reductase family protein [Acidimicrobiales bacterium]|nr:dihydrofolate reductase family protein [Acidimicrobiales bacterium]